MKKISRRTFVNQTTTTALATVIGAVAVSNTMEKIVKIFASYDTLKKAIETEKLTSGGKRGQGEQGYDEE